MEKKKKIALLNLPVDNNYGGMLQRYALMTVLQRMGHDVTHLFFRKTKRIKGKFPLYTFCKWLINYYLFKSTDRYPFEEIEGKRHWYHMTRRVLPFYNKYIKHTSPIVESKQLKNYTNFDVYVVGSDQSWRKGYFINTDIEIQDMFLGFVKNRNNIIRIAYGVSFGTDDWTFSDNEKKELSLLYRRFDASSFREDTAVTTALSYGWSTPMPVQVLDPTLLLKREDYIRLVNKTKTYKYNGEILCYILDSSNETNQIIDAISSKKKKSRFYLSIQAGQVSVEQWIRAFMDAEYVITDSYHGMLFSIIFNKPFYLIYNVKRGKDRFDSMLRLLEISGVQDEYDWWRINNIIDKEREKSLSFLNASLAH